MPLLVPRNQPPSQSGTFHSHTDVEDPRDESPTPALPRPPTSEARAGVRASSPQPQPQSNSHMPPIFPAPRSVRSESNMIARQQQQRRTFLPQLSHAKTFAARSSSHVDADSNANDSNDDDCADCDGDDGDVDANTPTRQPIPIPTNDEDTDDFKRAMWAGQANILVTVRVRPPCPHDRDDTSIVRVLDHKLIVVLDKLHPAGGSPQRAASVVMNSPNANANSDPLPVSLVRRQHHQTTHGHGLRKLRNVASALPSRSVSTNQASPSHHHHQRQRQRHGGGSTTNGTRSREKRYAFDYVFPPEDGQRIVYHHTTKFLIHGVLHGFNATVFAYGCTGAGKTHTMLGTRDEPGIMALTLDDLFQTIARVHGDPLAPVEYKVTVSFLEVYNENIRDLLATPPPQAPASQSTEFLDLREDPVRGAVVAGITEVEASDAQHVMKLLRRGNRHRSQEATAANAVSSRSHAVLQVLVEQRDKRSTCDAFGVDPVRGGVMTSTVKFGKLSLVDLAGSERAAVTQNRGQRLIEGANINRSLLALGNCINALGEKGASVCGGFVPYRDSKLTRLLKDSLGGNCRTVMIANVSPAAASVEETRNTLKYANRAKNIKTTVSRNVLSVDHHLTEYASVVAELKDEIVVLKQKLAQHSGSGSGSPAPRGLLASRFISPGRLKNRRPGAPNNDSCDDHDHDHDHDHDEIWKHAKLNEARGYIVQCFQQRQQLRRSLLEVDYCVEQLAKPLDGHVASVAAGEPEEPTTDGTSENQPRDHLFAASILEQIVDGPAHTRQQADKAVDASSDHAAEHVEMGIRLLLARKTQLVAQLEQNQSVMDAFRRGVEQSPLFASNELLRDVLLMEYRVGELHVENVVSAINQTLKDHEIAQLKVRLCKQTGNPHEVCVPFQPSVLFPSSGDGHQQSLELPAPIAEIARLLSPRPESKLDDDGCELHTARSSTGFAFLDDLRDRFYDRSNRVHHQQQLHASDGVKSSVSGGSSPRRQWGIHLSNSTLPLPYIRLKKKPPPALVATAATTTTASDYASANTSGGLGAQPRGSATTAAPYLTVLKHRRTTQQHRTSSNISSSQRKLPVVVPASS